MHHKKSIVVLQGMGTNTAITKYQMRQLEAFLNKDFNIIYLEPLLRFIWTDVFEDDGLFQLMKSQPEGSKYHIWCDQYKLQTLDEAFKYEYTRLVKMINDDPTIEGIIAFSQGTVLSTKICEKIEENKLQDRIKFYIMISANLFLHEYPYYKKMKPLPQKVLIVMGPKDWLYAGSLVLQGRFLNPQIIYHDQGHKIPKFNDTQLKQIKQFVQGPQPKL